jgi:hypothetical protein
VSTAVSAAPSIHLGPAHARGSHTPIRQVAYLDENEALPFMHTVWRAKIVWAVVFEGVVGEANLVSCCAWGAGAAGSFTPVAQGGTCAAG